MQKGLVIKLNKNKGFDFVDFDKNCESAKKTGFVYPKHLPRGKKCPFSWENTYNGAGTYCRSKQLLRESVNE